MAKKATLQVLNSVSDDGAESISTPYNVSVTLMGSAPILFHRWSCDAVEAKGAAAKGSKAKKSDDVESYVYRCEDGTIGVPGEYLRMAIIMAAKFRQDPRSPRKSASDLYKAGIVPLTDLASTGAAEPEYIDRRRVRVQQAAITRERPALRAGWKVTIDLQVLTPEYIDRQTLLGVINDAGRLVGIGDFRPTYGRFQVVEFK